MNSLKYFNVSTLPYPTPLVALAIALAGVACAGYEGKGGEEIWSAQITFNRAYLEYKSGLKILNLASR